MKLHVVYQASLEDSVVLILNFFVCDGAVYVSRVDEEESLLADQWKCS